jgi:hypothetical protein
MMRFGVNQMVARALVMGLMACFVSSGSANAQVTDMEARRQIEASYDVEVLGVIEGEIDERTVWLITIMVPPGDSNAAFMVSTLAIDQQTGDLVPAFRHRASGYELPGGLRNDKVGLRPDAMRTGTWR